MAESRVVEMRILKINGVKDEDREDREAWPAVILSDADHSLFLPVSVSWKVADQVAAALDGKPSDPRPGGGANPAALLVKALAHLAADPDHLILTKCWSGKGSSGSLHLHTAFTLVYRQEGALHEMPLETDDAMPVAATGGLSIRVPRDVVERWAVRDKEPPLVRGNRDDAAWEQELIRRGMGAWELERWDEACEALEPLSHLPVQGTDYIQKLGNAEWRRGRWRQALVVLHRALGEELARFGSVTLAGPIGREINLVHSKFGDVWDARLEHGPFITHEAPVMLEDFEDAGSSNMCLTEFYGLPGHRVPSPGGRPGYAFELPYQFKTHEWPMAVVVLDSARNWTGATGFSFDVYVALADPGATPLTLNVYLGRMRGRYYHEVGLKAGWNEIRLPFNSTGWRCNIPRDQSIPEPVDLAKISPVDAMTFMLNGTGRNDTGSIFLDNIRIE